jgi:hypothetical protein
VRAPGARRQPSRDDIITWKTQSIAGEKQELVRWFGLAVAVIAILIGSLSFYLRKRG